MDERFSISSYKRGLYFGEKTILENFFTEQQYISKLPALGHFYLALRFLCFAKQSI